MVSKMSLCLKNWAGLAVEAFRLRYFDRWEEAQGKNRTFFVGGLFDYVEGIVRYSRYLVEQHFAGRAGS